MYIMHGAARNRAHNAKRRHRHRYVRIALLTHLRDYKFKTECKCDRARVPKLCACARLAWPAVDADDDDGGAVDDGATLVLCYLWSLLSAHASGRIPFQVRAMRSWLHGCVLQTRATDNRKAHTHAESSHRLARHSGSVSRLRINGTERPRERKRVHYYYAYRCTPRLRLCMLAQRTPHGGCHGDTLHADSIDITRYIRV